MISMNRTCQMIHIRVSPVAPKQLHQEHVYGLCSRKTILGVHRKLYLDGVDNECSKTMLLLGINKGIMDKLVSYIQQCKIAGIGLERSLQPDTKTIMPSQLWSLSPVYVEKYLYSELEMMCLFNHFDMYVAFNMAELHYEQGQLGHVLLDGYEKVTPEWPQRSIIEKRLRDTLYKNR